MAAEQWHPGGDADKSDEEIKEGKRKLAGLRRLRQEFEELMSGMVG